MLAINVIGISGLFTLKDFKVIIMRVHSHVLQSIIEVTFSAKRTDGVPSFEPCSILVPPIFVQKQNENIHLHASGISLQFHSKLPKQCFAPTIFSIVLISCAIIKKKKRKSPFMSAATRSIWALEESVRGRIISLYDSRRVLALGCLPTCISSYLNTTADRSLLGLEGSAEIMDTRQHLSTPTL